MNKRYIKLIPKQGEIEIRPRHNKEYVYFDVCEKIYKDNHYKLSIEYFLKSTLELPDNIMYFHGRLDSLEISSEETYNEACRGELDGMREQEARHYSKKVNDIIETYEVIKKARTL